MSCHAHPEISIYKLTQAKVTRYYFPICVTLSSFFPRTCSYTARTLGPCEDSSSGPSFSLPPAPSLQSLCLSGGGKHNASWCLCNHLHQCWFRKIPAASDVVVRGGRSTRHIKGRDENQPPSVESTTAAFSR